MCLERSKKRTRSGSTSEEDDYPVIVVQSMPKFHEFNTSYSSQMTAVLLHAETQDGQPAFDLEKFRCVSTGPKLNGVFDIY